MKRAMIGFSALALAAALAAPARAQEKGTAVIKPASEARTSNFLGTTGLLFAPSAYVQGDGNATLFAYGTNDFFGGGILGGFGDRVEVGFGVFDLDDAFTRDTELLVNAKFQLVKESGSRPAVAVGVIDAINNLERDPSFYVVASKYFTRMETEQNFSLKGHVGGGRGIFDEEFFAGAELFFTRHISAMAEIVNGDFNVGGQWTYRGFSATVGLFDVDQLGGGVTYTARFK